MDFLIAIGYYLGIPGLYMFVAVKVTLLLRRRIAEEKKKIWMTIGCILFFLVVPFGDEILGPIYFRYLCASQGGYHIYQTVELGPEYFDKDGSPKFITETGELDEEMLGGRFVKKRDNNKKFSTLLNISRLHTFIEDTTNNKVIGRHVAFSYWGGGILNSLGFERVVASRCHQSDSYHLNLIKKVFLSKTDELNKEEKWNHAR
ncbi:MAG: hypothetical protein KQH63_21115 [Desulfobulbaceae bacterium]|nr:hypothetical protein [Desulfobulbaceae bacterium]